jgi:CheY-like chemotaxis protein
MDKKKGRSLLRGIRVLLVEDHRDTCITYAEGLRQAGADVATAASAQMALMAVQRQPFDVLVVDIGLPDADGNSFLRHVRALRPARGWDLPAIALTAYNTHQDRLHTVESGFRLHVPKPIAPEDLALLVDQVARRL